MKKPNISELKNIHIGKRAFILGMGRNFTVNDLELLNEEITFACNKIFLCFDETNWRPTYYSITDQVVARSNVEEVSKLQSTNIKCIFPSTVKKYLSFYDGAFWTNHISRPLNKNGSMKQLFSKDISEQTYGGYTVLYFLLQAAYYMGITEVILLGLDFSFNTEGLQSSGEKIGPDEILISSGEINHFHKDYRRPGELWVSPYLDKQKKSFTLAKNIFESEGKTILNASRKTKLDVLQKKSLDDII